jgi:hypothetical protein
MTGRGAVRRAVWVAVREVAGIASAHAIGLHYLATRVELRAGRRAAGRSRASRRLARGG